MVYVSGWSTPRPGRFTSGKDPVPTEQDAGWALGADWTGTENLVTNGIRSPDHPTSSESLYRLSYPGPHRRVWEYNIKVDSEQDGRMSTESFWLGIESGGSRLWGPYCKYMTAGVA